jgi:hypothetical protein
MFGEIEMRRNQSTNMGDLGVTIWRSRGREGAARWLANRSGRSSSAISSRVHARVAGSGRYEAREPEARFKESPQPARQWSATTASSPQRSTAARH